MKIGILTPQFGRGLSDRENHVWAVARGLSRSHCVRVLTRRHHPGGESNVHSDPAGSLVVETLAGSRLAEILEPTAGLWSRSVALPVTRRVLHWAYGGPVESLTRWADVLCLVGTGSMLLGALALESTQGQDKPLVLSPHLRVGRNHSTPLASLLLRNSTANLAKTWVEQAQLVAMGAPADRVAVVGNGPRLPKEADPVGFRRRYRIVGPMVLYAGRRAPLDGYETLSAAAGLVWQKRPETTFVFLTPGSRPGQRTSRTSHRGQVLHLSGLSDAERASAMAAATVFCAPCPEDGFGTSTMEAWSFARPVVAVSGPCLKELVMDGRDGLLVGQDAHAVAAGLLRVLADPALASRLGDAGARKIADRFSWDRVVSTTESLLMRVCAQHRHQAVPEPLVSDAAPHQAMTVESELTEMTEPA